MVEPLSAEHSTVDWGWSYVREQDFQAGFATYWQSQGWGGGNHDGCNTFVLKKLESLYIYIKNHAATLLSHYMLLSQYHKQFFYCKHSKGAKKYNNTAVRTHK